MIGKPTASDFDDTALFDQLRRDGVSHELTFAAPSLPPLLKAFMLFGLLLAPGFVFGLLINTLF